VIDDALFVLSWLLIVAGGFFTLVGAIGLVRMPDVYTRMHAASVTDTLGAGLLLIGFMLQAGLSLVLLKLVFLFVLLFFVSPVATHALASAALHYGIKPMLSHDRRRRLDADDRPRGGEEDFRIEAAQ
jgi:multicomponent Na+:H+ antiporter subunit G